LKALLISLNFISALLKEFLLSLAFLELFMKSFRHFLLSSCFISHSCNLTL
jgi:hypothetical protein